MRFDGLGKAPVLPFRYPEYVVLAEPRGEQGDEARGRSFRRSAGEGSQSFATEFYRKATVS
jgi:hypothetical protein